MFEATILVSRIGSDILRTCPPVVVSPREWFCRIAKIRDRLLIAKPVTIERQAGLIGSIRPGNLLRY